MNEKAQSPTTPRDAPKCPDESDPPKLNRGIVSARCGSSARATRYTSATNPITILEDTGKIRKIDNTVLVQGTE